MCLKDVSCDSKELEIENKGKSFYSDVAIIYGRTWVQEILSSEGTVDGFHLHIGDSEESIDAYVMKNGDYRVVYNQNTQLHTRADDEFSFADSPK